MIVVFQESKPIEEKLNPLDGATEALNALFEEASEEDLDILFLSSGGSSLNLLSGLNTDFMSAKFTICPLDERYSLDPSENNMEQIMQTSFFSKARENGAGLIDTRVSHGESQDSLALRYNDELIEWINSHPEGKIIATIGIGPDGHLSGIMPHPEDPQKFHDLFDDGNSDHLVVGYNATGKNEFPLRVTTTMNLIRRIDASVCYVVGENKKEALKRVMADEGDLPTTPARILKDIPGKVLLFTDQI